MQMIIGGEEQVHISVHYDKGTVPDISIKEKFLERGTAIKFGDVEIWLIEREA